MNIEKATVAYTCSSCNHFEPVQTVCRRHPPSAFLIASPEGKPVVISGWPPVRSEQFCGEHSSKGRVLTAVS